MNNRTVNERPFHPSSFLFPDMTDGEFADLVRSIREQGQIDPIVMLDGLVFDGRHRWIACEELGIEPRTEEWTGTEDELVRVSVARNLARRHLTPAQKADIALRVATLRKGDKKHLVSGSITQSEAARMFGVSPDSLQRMRKVEEGGSERLVVATLAGEIPLARAAKIAALSKQQQDEVLEAGAIIRGSRLATRRDVAKERVLANQEASAFPQGQYMLLLADPPWSYGNDAMTTHMNPRHHYDDMSIEEIAALSVDDLLDKDALAMIWTTSFHLADTIARILPAWGLDYSACATWKKHKAVVGAGILRQTSEFLVFAKKGNGVGKPQKQLISCFEAPQGRHSEKPELVHEWIESAFPDWMPKIELFARASREGWTVFGNDPALSANGER